MDFDVRLVATNFTSTVAPKYLLCVWTGVMSDNSCKAFFFQRIEGIGEVESLLRMLIYCLTSWAFGLSK